MKDADHRGMGAVEGPKNAPFRPAIIAHIGDFYQHEVAMHRRSDSVRRNKDISRQAGLQARVDRNSIRNYKPEAIPMQAEFPNDSVLSGRGLRNRVAVRIHRNQLTARNQFLKTSRQFTPLVPMQPELTDELLIPSRLLRLALNLFQDDGVRGHIASALGNSPYRLNAKCQVPDAATSKALP